MIGMAVSENQMLELIWRAAKRADRPKDGRLFIRVTASISVNPSSPSMRNALAIPIGTMSAPLITRFTAMSRPSSSADAINFSLAIDSCHIVFHLHHSPDGQTFIRGNKYL